MGGNGNDTISFLDTGTISVSNLASISGVEYSQLSAGTNTLNVGAGYTVLGSSSDDILIGGTGVNNTINAGNGNDTFKYTALNFDSHDTLDGGSGTDTLLFTTAGTLTEAMFTNITSIEKIQLADGGNTITLDASAKGATLLGGIGADIFKYAIGDLTNIS